MDTIKSRLTHIAGMHGYDLHQAWIMLNPFYWIRYWYRGLRFEARLFFERRWGLSRVLVKDGHCDGAWVALLKGVKPGTFIVMFEVEAVMAFRRQFDSESRARTSYLEMRERLWRIMDDSPFGNNGKGHLPLQELHERIDKTLDELHLLTRSL